MYTAKILFTGLILLTSGMQAEIKELPDPFLMNDGSRVRNIRDWNKRREELKEVIQLFEYGHFAPPESVTVVSTSADSVIDSKNGAITKRSVKLKTGGGKSVEFFVNLFIPGQGKGPFPVILDGDLCWGSLLKKITPDGLSSLVTRGYVIAEFDRTAFSPDKDVRNSLSGKSFDTGSVVEWAWGFQRVTDYLITLKITDISRIAVTGHSRGGKAALLAGAFDERIALVAPNCSGAGGSGPSRFVDTGGEKLDDIVTRFPYWFCSNFRNYMGDEKFKLPFDQHCLVSLVAPRAYLCTNGLADKWANPKGTAQAHLAAREVFESMGAGEKMGIFYINTGHDHNIDKWIALVDFADKVFFGKPAAYDYSNIPFPELEKAYSWKAPSLK